MNNHWIVVMENTRIKTEHFNLQVTPTDRIAQYNITLDFCGKPVLVNNPYCIKLDIEDVASIPISELKKLPFRFNIDQNRKFKTGNSPVDPYIIYIVGYTEEEVIIEISCYHPIDVDFFGDNLNRDRYFRILRNELIKDPRIEFEIEELYERPLRSFDEEWEMSDEELDKDPIRGIDLTFNLTVKSLGELSNSVNKIMEEFEQNVKLVF